MELSIIIPARNEMFLAKTIKDILTNIRGDTEVIAVCDGNWADPLIEDNPRVTLIYHSESIGQRAATNKAAKFSRAKYLMKLDAHCGFAEGFDAILMADMQDDFTMAPIMRNLHAFDWVCKKCGDRRYQGITPTECPKCDNKTEFERDIVWISKTNPQSTSYCFDPEPHFQYFTEFKKRPEGQGDLTETMSLQGSCFMATRDKYFELNLCDEILGSWGSQGIEVACKTWLSGGRVVVNHKTWYSHMFRTKGGDFGFPYHLSGRQTQHAKNSVKDLFFNNKWPLQKRPLSWLLEKFWPVPGWTEEKLVELKRIGSTVKFKESIQEPIPITSEKPEVSLSEKKLSKGLVYYTNNKCDEKILSAVQENIKKASNGLKIVSVSLKPIDFGENYVLNLESGYLTMFKQILTGLESLDTDIAFLVECDVLYHPCHFEFVPLDRTKIYYNTNIWQLRTSDGHAVYFDAKRTSQLCSYRDILVEHYRKRVERVEKEGFSRAIGFEPGSHHRKERIDDLESDIWVSKYPNVDIKHGRNLTSARWSTAEFRDQRNCRNWKEADEVPYWGKTKDRFDDFIIDIKRMK